MSRAWEICNGRIVGQRDRYCRQKLPERRISLASYPLCAFLCLCTEPLCSGHPDKDGLNDAWLEVI